MKRGLRHEARLAGRDRYFTGAPCRNGHIAERRTSNGQCTACAAETARAYRARHPETVAEAKRAYREANRDKERAATRAYREANAGKVRSAMRAWREENADRVKAQRNAWQDANPGYFTEARAKRRARLRDQVCCCCAPSVVQRIYRQARKKGLHVDHIWPLAKGGKHCRHNFQLLPPSDNLRKHATFTAKDAMKYFYNLSIAAGAA